MPAWTIFPKPSKEPKNDQRHFCLRHRREQAALQILQETGEYVGRGLGKAASLLNLKRYILGGGVMQSYDLMAPHIRAAFEHEAFARPNQEAEILPTALRYEAGLLGAAAITLK